MRHVGYIHNDHDGLDGHDGHESHDGLRVSNLRVYYDSVVLVPLSLLLSSYCSWPPAPV